MTLANNYDSNNNKIILGRKVECGLKFENYLHYLKFNTNTIYE